MKGILLAGGSGSRLYPLTTITSKQLLPVYDKPMICYPLSTLMLLGIKEILIISTPEDTPRIQEYLGDGSKYGISLSYKVQDEPKGIAEAFTIGADFIGGDDVALILGDNIFHLGRQIQDLAQMAKGHTGATIFGYHVSDPERFGVIEYDKNYNVLSLEEKPQVPKSNYAAVGLYFYDNKVVEYTKNLQPSARGELEITDLNLKYLAEGTLKAKPFKRGTAWLDAGTPDSLLEASNFIGMMERRQGLKISCLEEVAFNMGYISGAQLQDMINPMKKGSDYRKYLEHVLDLSGYVEGRPTLVEAEPSEGCIEASQGKGYSQLETLMDN